MRRVLRSKPPPPVGIRKSVSMDTVPGPAPRLPDPPQEDERAAPEAEEEELAIRPREEETRRAADFTAATLRPLGRRPTMSRSLVPMMRKMFERAKSCDPAVLSGQPGDGTESSRSSFSQYQLSPSLPLHAASVSPSASSLSISESSSSTEPRSRQPRGSGLITKLKARILGKGEQ